jgi:hypothetical protein
MDELPSSKARRVALLVDGDNLPPSLSGPILKAAERLGQVNVRRVYAAEAGFRAWQEAPGYRPIQVGGAKNGTDLLLCIEAMELACKGGFEAFALASDDRDFSHLAHWLRERGMHVLGFGTAKSPAGWRAACSEFLVLGVPAASHGEHKPSTSAPRAAVLSDTDSKIRDLIRDLGEGGSIGIGRLGERMGAVHKVTLERLQVSTWRAYLRTKPSLYEMDPKAVTARVRWVGP